MTITNIILTNQRRPYKLESAWLSNVQILVTQGPKMVENYKESSIIRQEQSATGVSPVAPG